jgi:hypothetical protein
MNSEETAQTDAIRAALNSAKQLLSDAAAQINIARLKSDALIVTEKNLNRADAYTLAFRSKAKMVRLGGEIDALRGKLMEDHADISLDLQNCFTANTYVLAGPVR